MTTQLRPLLTDDQVKMIADPIAQAIGEISHGGLSGPMGLEGVAMALAGEGSYGASNNMAVVIAEAIGTGLSEIAQAVMHAGERIAQAVKEGRD